MCIRDSISTLGKMGGKSISLYLITTVIAISVGLGLVNLIQPGKFIKSDTRVRLVEKYSDKTISKVEMANATKNEGPLQPLIDLVPDNIFKSSSDNRNMLQVIFFAVLFGVSMVLIPSKKSAPTRAFFESVNAVSYTHLTLPTIYSV